MALTIRMLLAWILAVIFSTVLATVLTGASAAPGSNLFERLLGMGLIVGVPMLVFSTLVALPLSSYLATIQPTWAATRAAVILFAGVAAVLAMAIFPGGWNGAAQAFVFFAALLGLFWGLIGFVIARTPTAA